MKKENNILKKAVKQKDFDKLKNGEAINLEFDITPYNCNKLRGLGNVCPFSLPFNDENRMCQKNGQICCSGKILRYKDANIRLSKSDEEILCDVVHIKGQYDKKPLFVITVKVKENNKELNK